MFYAIHNRAADLDNGNRGFANTWEVSRFATRQERAAFVEKFANQLAEAVTRKRAEQVFAAQYHCVGETPPRGGLFGAHDGWQWSDTRFWNEQQAQLDA